MIFFLDLHGVLIDFVGQCNDTFDVDIYADPKHHGDWHAPRHVIRNFGERVSRQPASFWAEMPLLEGAHAILEAHDNPVILTTPWGNAASFVGTRALIERHFLNVPYIFAMDKTPLAKGNYLLDDKEENIDAWNLAGGIGILHPGVMNNGTTE